MPLTHIALGANLPGPAGSPESTVAAAAERLASLGRITARSSLYSTAPVGIADQPRFLNAVIALETRLAPRDLLNALLAIERSFGRDRTASVPGGPRILDLDILFYDGITLSEHGLEIPHPRLAQRAFVLIPLNEIDSQLRDPRTGRTVSQLLARLSSGRTQLTQEVAPIASTLWPAGKRSQSSP
jgi:2-amino-4-hydroxy-6-hydroxymethyldihydropteridine diphosphokinase